MAAIWRFSDETTLKQGGTVHGDSPLAASLRFGLGGVADGLPLSVSMWAEPGGSEQLDPNDIAILDVWARNLARVHGVEVVEAPTYDYPPDPRGELEEPEDGEIN